MTGLDQLARHALSRPAGTPAVQYDGHWYDWAALRHVADRLGSALDASGANPAAPIVFLPRNRPSAVAALLGLIARGRTLRMVYAFQAPERIASELIRLRPAVTIAAAADFTPQVHAALHALGGAGIALTEMDAGLLPDPGRVTGDFPPVTGAPRIEILTSGTTGPPKHFPIPYPLIATLASGATMARGPVDDPADAPPMLMHLPMGNIGGIYTVLPTLLNGQRGILLDRFSVAAWHRFILDYRPAFANLLPAAVRMVLDADIPPADLAGIRSIGAGAAPVDPAAQQEFLARYGIPVLQSYGATEFGGPVTAMTLAQFEDYGVAKLGSVGRPLPGAKLRVVDARSGAELPAGEQGLLEVVSPRIGPDWIRTSDLAVIDADGFIFHKGRADGAIMRGGFKMLPETIETALNRHPAVAVSAVTGVADPRLGQVPAAAVQVRAGMDTPDIAALEAHLRAHLPATHIPARWRIVTTLPRTPSMKVDRMALGGLFDSDDD